MVEFKIEDGKIEREEIITVNYKKNGPPGMNIEIARPYEVKAEGSRVNTQEYTLRQNGGRARNSAEVGKMGLLDAIRAAVNAFKGAKFEGGLTEADVTKVGETVDSYNEKVKAYNQVAGRKTEIISKTTVRIDDLAKAELEELKK